MMLPFDRPVGRGRTPSPPGLPRISPLLTGQLTTRLTTQVPVTMKKSPLEATSEPPGHGQVEAPTPRFAVS
jgi:hypothetical protein